MIGKYTPEEMEDLIQGIREGHLEGLKKNKKFFQSRALLVMQFGKIFGSFQESSLWDEFLNVKEKIDFSREFHIYLLTGKNVLGVSQSSFKDTLEFSYLTYHGFALAYTLQGEKMSLIEELLRKHRLPSDLWHKSGFQLWKWETQAWVWDGIKMTEK